MLELAAGEYYRARLDSAGEDYTGYQLDSAGEEIVAREDSYDSIPELQSEVPPAPNETARAACQLGTPPLNISQKLRDMWRCCASDRWVGAPSLQCHVIAAMPRGSVIAAMPRGSVIAAMPCGSVIAAMPCGSVIAAMPCGSVIAALPRGSVSCCSYMIST